MQDEVEVKWICESHATGSLPRAVRESHDCGSAVRVRIQRDWQVRSTQTERMRRSHKLFILDLEIKIVIQLSGIDQRGEVNRKGAISPVGSRDH